ncbi:hypothetical protein SDC9_52621 [bioreactor metagenome]|uniref:Uncharacterized protein n=1 Tax=bioreactor metagenome TaxID=1076179 RepID=A0A644WRF5_9ZZZZ
MFYVTAYSEYPIYEPAEGGYYYPGTQVVSSRPFQNRRRARQYINKLYREETARGENTDKYWHERADHMRFGCGSKYVGEGWYICLERKQGCEESGWEPYC